mmetsp:Transcript_4673/g.10694  ORF Transcript_4673/g.10694 Transcript_4673/m.10694 type:complete len:201 (-) Transcript_4673:222-824(-)
MNFPSVDQADRDEVRRALCTTPEEQAAEPLGALGPEEVCGTAKGKMGAKENPGIVFDLGGSGTSFLCADEHALGAATVVGGRPAERQSTPARRAASVPLIAQEQDPFTSLRVRSSGSSVDTIGGFWGQGATAEGDMEAVLYAFCHIQLKRESFGPGTTAEDEEVSAMRSFRRLQHKRDRAMRPACKLHSELFWKASTWDS